MLYKSLHMFLKTIDKQLAGRLNFRLDATCVKVIPKWLQATVLEHRCSATTDSCFSDRKT